MSLNPCIDLHELARGSDTYVCLDYCDFDLKLGQLCLNMMLNPTSSHDSMGSYQR